jgi:hypothetical protein
MAAASSFSAASRVARCPFHDGATTLDLLLAELNPLERDLFDAVLDLRSLCTARNDALACLEQFFHVRSLLGDRHYLAFYRVRCWAQRTFVVSTRSCRQADWASQRLPLDCARFDELLNTALAALADASGSIPAAAHVRVDFAAADEVRGHTTAAH